jgi:translation initiation factor 4E
MADIEKTATDAPDGAEDVSAEDGEAQEVVVDMESQADQIRTVFSDPTNFNVKVRERTRLETDHWLLGWTFC